MKNAMLVSRFSLFFFLLVDVPLFQHCLLKRRFLFYNIASASLLKISRLYLWGKDLFPRDFLFCYINLSIFSAISYFFDY